MTTREDLDIDVDVDLSDETTRSLLARRLGSEVAGEVWTQNDPETARKSAMSRDRAIGHLDNMLKGIVDWDTRGARSKRGLLDNFQTWEAVTGEEFQESLEDACEEMDRLDIQAIGKWLLS